VSRDYTTLCSDYRTEKVALIQEYKYGVQGAKVKMTCAITDRHNSQMERETAKKHCRIKSDW